MGDGLQLPGRGRARRRTSTRWSGSSRTLQSTVAEAIAEEEEEEARGGRGRGHRHPRLRPGRAGDQARQQHPRPGGHRGRLGHPLRAEEGEMRIRFRVDGVLQETARVPKRMVAGVVSRIKIMSELDIAEKRIPQDGRVGVTVEDRRVDLRVTTLPTQRGEGASIRHPRRGRGAAHPRRPWNGGRGAPALRELVPEALRRGAGHRADRRRQVDHALRGAAGAQQRRQEHRHDRGPGRVPAQRRQPDRGSPQGRARPSPPASARCCAPTPT